MRSIENAVTWAENIANDDSHGYAQDRRDGPDYDCSSLIRHALLNADFPITFTYTGNMKDDLLAHGFNLVEFNSATGEGLKRGDILLYHNYANGNGHTAMYVGNGKIVHATSNEKGGISGGQIGDQTGKEICVANYFNNPWYWAFRYAGEQGDTDYEYYTVQPNDTLWYIALKFNTTVDELVRLNNITNPALIYVGQVLKVKELTPKPIPETDTIRITIEGVSIKNCKCEGNVIIIEI